MGVEDDRRPIAARRWRISQAAAAWLVRRRVGANAISVAGMVAGLLAGLALWSTAQAPAAAVALWLVAALLVQVRLVANMLDGMVAIGAGKASKLGELYNEIPDRVSDTAILVGLGYAAGGQTLLGYLAALGAMATAYVRSVGQAAGAGATFGGPMAKQQRMFVVTLCALYCAVAGPYIGGSPGPGVPAAALGLIVAGTVLTAGLRLRRIALALVRR
jgi:phosphatidylglycerophosphate synthase